MITFKDFLLERREIETAERLANLTSKTSFDGHRKGEYLRIKRAHPSTIYSVVSKMEKSQNNPSLASFKIKDLVGTQSTISIKDKNIMRSKIADKNPQHIHIVTHKGVHYIDDGHHAIFSARLRGEKNITAKHTNLDSA